MRNFRKQLEKQIEENAKPYLSPDAVMCGIGVIDKKDNTKIIHSCNIVGEIYEKDGITYVTDVLDHEHKIYEVINLDDIVNEKIDEVPCYEICYSYYDLMQFKDILKMKTEEEIIKYLIDYNIKNNTNIYWSFLDENETKKVDKIAEENRKRYHLKF